jgi:putative glycosyltransferase (TIGR04372 family)
MIKIGSVRESSFGHLILNTIRYFAERKYFFLVIVSSKKKIVNRYVYNFLKKNYSTNRVFFYENEFLNLIIKFFYKIQKKIKIFSFFYANISWIHHEKPRTDYGSIYRFYDSYLYKKKNLKKFGNIKKFTSWRKKNNLTGKYVCIFSRDSGYYKEKIIDPRNFSFSNYKSTINKLIKLNYKVVRMGRDTKEKYKTKNKNFFDFDDLTKNETKDHLEFIEFMLFKNCKFIIGSTSGIQAYALLFDKLFFFVNNFPAGRIPIFKKCLYINKKYKKINKLIPYDKIDKKLLLSEDYKKIKSKGYKIVNNTEKEICDLVTKNINKQNGINLKNKYNFIIEGEGGLCSKYWYKKNYKLFKS